MLRSVRECSCFNYMVTSIRTMGRSGKHPQIKMSKPPESAASSQSKSENQTANTHSGRKASLKVKNQNLPQANQTSNIKNEQLNQIPDSERRCLEFSGGEKVSCAKSQKKQPQEGISERPESSFAGESDDLSEESECDSLPTEKSEIIMNDLNLSVDQNENKFMNSLAEFQDFDAVFEVMEELPESNRVFKVSIVRDKITKKKLTCYKLKPIQEFQKMWQSTETQESSIADFEAESIDRYEELFEHLKKLIKCLVKVKKVGCRYSRSIVDYEYKPPTFSVEESKKVFSQGSLTILMESVDSTLEDLLSNEGKIRQMIKTDKKKLIFQLLTGLEDIHANQLLVGSLSCKNVCLDMFGNVKLFGLRLGTSSDSEAPLSQQIMVLKQSSPLEYWAPEELCENQNMAKTSFSFMQFSIGLDNLGRKTQLWHLGIVIAKILMGKSPFAASSKEEQLKAIKGTLTNKDTGKILSTKLLGLSFHQIELIEALLKWNPIERDECSELLKLRYFEDLLNDSCEYQASEEARSQN